MVCETRVTKEAVRERAGRRHLLRQKKRVISIFCAETA